MSKVQVKKSVEGGKYKVVILESELVDALLKFDRMNDTATFLIVNGIIKVDSDIADQLFAIGEDCKSVFRKYNLDKYDVRAHYKWNESKKI
jgi:hypothetical protein